MIGTFRTQQVMKSRLAVAWKALIIQQMLKRIPPKATPPGARARGPKAVKVARQALLDAAAEVFARNGLQGTSLRAIARQADCDPALIYYHFANKEALLGALAEARAAAILADLGPLAGPGDTRPVAARLWAMLRTCHEHLHASPGLRSLARGEAVRGAPGLKGCLDGEDSTAARLIRSVFEAGIRQGAIRPGLDPSILAFALVAMELAILDRLDPDAVALAERTGFEVFWRGIATRPDEPLPFLPPADRT